MSVTHPIFGQFSAVTSLNKLSSPPPPSLSFLLLELSEGILVSYTGFLNGVP